MESQGFQVFRFSNLDVIRRFFAVCSQIDRIAKDRVNNCNG